MVLAEIKETERIRNETSSISILLVDDIPVFRQGLAALLKKNFEEFDVIGEASGSVETLARVGQLKPDVVLMDANMQNGDGIETIRTIRESFPTVRVVVLSVSDREDDLFRAVKAGASAYLLKTARLDELAESIRVVASGAAALSPYLMNKLMEEFRSSTRNSRSQQLYSLTRREKEVLEFAARGDSNKEIADKCCISITTVKAHFRNILGKLEVKNRTGAVTLATANGLLERRIS